MPPRLTPNLAAQSAREDADLLAHVLLRLKSQDPAWYAQLPASTRAAGDRLIDRGQQG